jgi:hypothetical protein
MRNNKGGGGEMKRTLEASNGVDNRTYLYDLCIRAHWSCLVNVCEHLGAAKHWWLVKIDDLGAKPQNHR